VSGASVRYPILDIARMSSIGYRTDAVPLFLVVGKRCHVRCVCIVRIVVCTQTERAGLIPLFLVVGGGWCLFDVGACSISNFEQGMRWGGATNAT
jgi:hypothetical protein